MDEFTDIFCAAFQEITNEYFQLPVAGKEDPIYRERVYCYELYHQLRSLWPQHTEYSLSGEVDKNGHELIRGDELDRKKPDFLVHEPGIMEHNYLIIEVKPSNADRKGIEKDLKTLTAFRTKGGYSKAIFLIYGGPDSNLEKIKTTSKNIFAEINNNEKINLDLIELWHHPNPGEQAYLVNWE